jgi:hypothetical protein
MRSGASGVFFCILCFLVPFSSGFGGSKDERREDKKLLSVLNYDWAVAKRSVRKEESLERARKLRKILQGDRREKTERGPIGRTGPVGKIGKRGPIGKKGDTGLRGEIGPQGCKGDTGPEGATGPIGKIGAAGKKGDVGLKGEQGGKGDTGPEGIAGPIGNTGATGAEGPVGATGPKGQRGSIGPKGPTGASNITIVDGVLNVTFRPQGGSGNGIWHAIIITPSGKKLFSCVNEGVTQDIKVAISPVEIGVYAISWRNGFEIAHQLTSVLREIEIESVDFNGDNFVYSSLPSSQKGEQRTVTHVVVEDMCQ